MFRILFIVFAFGSCNPANKILNNQEQFDRIGKKWLETHPCVNDSSVIYIQGKSDSIYINVPSSIDTRGSISVIDYLDSIRSAANQINKICEPKIKDAYKNGYTAAINKVKTIKIPIYKTDTIKIVVKDKQYNQIVEQENKDLKQLYIQITDKNHKLENKNNKWFIYFLITLFLLAIVSYTKLNKTWS